MCATAEQRRGFVCGAGDIYIYAPTMLVMMSTTLTYTFTMPTMPTMLTVLATLTMLTMRIMRIGGRGAAAVRELGARAVGPRGSAHGVRSVGRAAGGCSTVACLRQSAEQYSQYGSCP